MAIAYGNAKTAFTASSFTGPTVTGSNTYGILVNAGDVNAQNITGITWGGVAMFPIGNATIPGPDRNTTMWGIHNPASAAPIVITGGSFFHGYADYYTGVNQSDTPDSSNTNTVASGGTTLVLTTTVIASNCWLIYSIEDAAGNITYTTSVGSMRQANTDGNGAPAYGDSNGTVGTGSQSVTLTAGSGTAARAGVIMSLAPFGSVTTITPTKLLLGVGL